MSKTYFIMGTSEPIFEIEMLTCEPHPCWRCGVESDLSSVGAWEILCEKCLSYLMGPPMVFYPKVY